uniref:Uncharacterized protein n=1 Tax=Romanomermis culicivorax TaxID=13658 RepID=A0A915HY55_ROMCU
MDIRDKKFDLLAMFYQFAQVQLKNIFQAQICKFCSRIVAQISEYLSYRTTKIKIVHTNRTDKL